MLIKYKRKKDKESAYECDQCGTVFKFSWLEIKQLDGTCPFCWAKFDIKNVQVVELPQIKNIHRLPTIVKLQLAKMRLDAEYKERCIKSWEDQSLTDFSCKDPELAQIMKKIENLQHQVAELKIYTRKNKLNLNDIYNWHGTNAKKF